MELSLVKRWALQENIPKTRTVCSQVKRVNSTIVDMQICFFFFGNYCAKGL